jgi:endonuclease/exonuclease/phosphatase family metal-dependent hydrolase
VRNTLDTMVSTPAGNDVRVLSGHYEWPVEGVDHQARQVGAVAGALDAWDGPVIWGADFNVESGSAVGREEHRIMGEAGLADSFDAAPADGRVPLDQRDTHPGRTNGSGIDRIYSSTDGTRVLETHVGREAGDASDHSPVITELELQPAAAS